jgi:NADH-quinone oxidoreductase subunit I
MGITIRPVRRPAHDLGERIYLLEAARGLGVTFRHFFLNLWRHILHVIGVRAAPGAVTIQYPEAPPMLGRRARLRHRLLRRPDGSPRCTSCLLCETICPANCIHITAEGSPDVMVEKRAKSFDIDLGLCVFCGHCVEACPVDAIRMDVDDVELSAYDRAGLIWSLQDLLEDKVE